jgi:hypothetical protein
MQVFPVFFFRGILTQMKSLCCVLILATLHPLVWAQSHGADLADLREEVAALRKRMSESSKPSQRVDAVIQRRTDCNFTNEAVVAKQGKLHIGGLVQVWYQVVQNDSEGGIRPASGNLIDAAEPNEAFDNDTFRIRRAQLRFDLELHENISAVVMLDPARESNHLFKALPAAPIRNANQDNTAFVQTGAGMQAGSAITPQLLRDAYLNFHGVIPHHDVTVGQFKPPSGEEGWRRDGELDFIERAMAATVNNVNDLGMMVHGSWFDERLQYWAGLFNGATGTVLANTELIEGGNRSDDNDAKDIAVRLQVRPVWSCDRWHGRLELGYARTEGVHGESGREYDSGAAVNGLNREQTSTWRQSAWASYRPNGQVSGWWFRGEWNAARDRYHNHGLFGAPTSLLQTGLGFDSLGRIVQLNPAPVTAQGWSASTGYRLSDSIFYKNAGADCRFARVLRSMEFAFRYEVYQNVATEDLVAPDRHTDLFKTQACTAGISYYLKDKRAKLQLNYVWVDDPGSAARGLREVRNDVLAVSFQVGF